MSLFSQNKDLVKPRLGLPRFWFKNLSRVSLIFQFWIFDAKNSEYSIWNASLSKNYTMNGPFSDRHISRLRQEIALVINLFIVPYILNWYAIYHTIHFTIQNYVIGKWISLKQMLPLSNLIFVLQLHHWFIPTKAWYQSLMTSSCNGVCAGDRATKHSGNSGIVKCECRSPRL